VLDPFAGSGTVGAACVRLMRNSIQFEIDRRYKPGLLKRLRREMRLSKIPQEIVLQ